MRRRRPCAHSHSNVGRVIAEPLHKILHDAPMEIVGVVSRRRGDSKVERHLLIRGYRVRQRHSIHAPGPIVICRPQMVIADIGRAHVSTLVNGPPPMPSSACKNNSGTYCETKALAFAGFSPPLTVTATLVYYSPNHSTKSCSTLSLTTLFRSVEGAVTVKLNVTS